MTAIVVGTGMITSLGDTETTWKSMLGGVSGISKIRRFPTEGLPVQFGAEVIPQSPLRPDECSVSLYDQLTDAVIASALANVDLSSISSDRIGVFAGCEAVRPDLAVLARRFSERRLPTPLELESHHPARQARRIAQQIGACGPVVTLSIACTSSAQAVGEALWAVRRGEVDVAIAFGVDVLVHPLMILGFSRLGALSTRNASPASASRPFDRERDGFVLGDGAGAVVLASPKLAERVGQKLGSILGYASTCNAWRITDTPPDGRGTRQALLEALRDAGSDRPIAYINAHGTATAQNDASEAAGIGAAFGDLTKQIPVSSTKSMIGHLVAACGVVETIVTLRAVTERIAPPTINLDSPDLECPLRHIAHTAQSIHSGLGISNAAGFGGSNTSIVVEAP